ncbi:MAG: sodium/proline symporter PutP [Burkholderiales bacterium]|jgi:sodium/proline symporter|nr:sodium/proline symporter PutP [Burkholderiales bacterium]
MLSHISITITFFVYIFLMLFVGYLGWRQTHNLSDYILGGRRLGAFVTALSAGASDMSGWLLMGLPGAVFLSGISESWIAIGLTIGAWCNWRWVAGRLRVYTERTGNALTLPNYLANRFEDNTHWLRLFSALVILIFFTIYCASGIVAGARLFASLFDVSYQSALLIAAVATISYVFIGGFLAVSWTDTIQASLMITALIMVPLMVIYKDGGVSNSVSVIQSINVSYVDMLKDLNVIAIISLLAWGLGYFGQPHILVRFMAAKSAREIKPARRISLTWMVLCLAGAVAVGFFGLAYFHQNPSEAVNVNENAETVFIELSKLLFHPWIAGMLLAAILAAIMSTLSCQLLVSSSALTGDIYRIFLRRNAGARELVWIGRTMVLLVSIIAIVIANNPDSRVLKMVSYAWAGFGASFGPVILISLFWKNMTRNGALAGMIVGAATVIIWKQGQFFNLYEIVPGFVFASLAVVIFSHIGKPATATMKETFAKVDDEIKSQI